MHIEVDREELLKHLELTGRISGKHQTLPVLQCVLCRAEGETLSIAATNLELGIETTVSARVTDAGVCAVPASVLQQTVGLLNEQKVTLATDGDVLVVKTAKSTTTIKTLAHEEFPSIPELSGDGQVINGALFALGVKTAAFAASQSSIKPELGSVLVHQQREHTLTFVATDSFRLVERTVSQKAVVLSSSLLIPYRNALELARICELTEVDPVMIVSENQLALRFGEAVYVTTRLIEAAFPDYQQIIPKEFATSVTVLRGDLMHALKKTNIFTNAYLQVRVQIDPEANTITFTSDNGELGKTEETVAATVAGDALELSFNQRYLTDPLASFVDDSVILRFAGVGRPMVMEGSSEKSLRYLVMPMNR